jgi:hypothetical protein
MRIERKARLWYIRPFTCDSITKSSRWLGWLKTRIHKKENLTI